MQRLAALIAAVFLLTASADAKPRLIVVVSVDQMRPDTLTRFAAEYTGGLKRLLDRGLLYRGLQDHAATQTGPGHSTMLTGCHPARTGIIANSWLDRTTWKAVYCCEGKNEPVFGVKDKHRSPRLLLVSTLGDWMKAADPKARVYAVSCKDRGAILMAGQRPDGAFWLEKTGPGISTSAFYFKDGLPAWVTAFNNDGWLEKLPKTWTYKPVATLRADDDPRESSRYSRKSPHPLNVGTGAGARTKTFAHLYASPYGDLFTLRFARLLVERFELGADEVTDLLAISLSATDIVGHAYGPFSQEIRDTTLRLDRNLGTFFDFLDQRGVPFTVVLAADHGVLPIPDRERVSLMPLAQRLAADVQKQLGAGDWFRITGSGLAYTREEKARDAVLAAARKEPAFETVLSRADVAGAGHIARLVRNSYHAERSGDVFAIAREHVLITTGMSGTSHGSPWRYDREVPILFCGEGIPAGRRGDEVRTIDIAPTLARLLGLPAPSVDGEALPLK